MAELLDKVKFFFRKLRKEASKSSILTNINDSNEDMVQIVQGHGFESEENLKNSIKHNIPSSIVVLDESEKQRLRYNLIQMNIQDNELLF